MPLEQLAARKARVAEIRAQARALLDGGATGVQVAAAISEATDRLIGDLWNEELEAFAPDERQRLGRQSAVVAVGGTGRGELAPDSDCDLLFLYESPVRELFAEAVARLVRALWDAGLKLGHSVRTVSECVALARQDAQIATALVEARRLWGSEAIVARLRRRFWRGVVRGRSGAFINDCIAARAQERQQHGSTVQQLQPDIKRSLGGLRDIHLIRWIGYARYGTPGIEALRMRGALTKDDARALLAAYEFLTRIRIELHFLAGRSQDVLSRDAQLRLAEERGVEGTAGQRPVERLMQTYFRHCGAVADIARRFVARNRPRSLTSRLVGYLVSHHADGRYRVGTETIDVLPRYRKGVCGDLEQMLGLFHAAVLYGVSPTPRLMERLRQAVPLLGEELSDRSIQTFADILRRTQHLGRTLRDMYAVGLLEWLIPDMRHTRCLLQFNQYHSYTVDEHTLQAVEAAAAFERDPGPVGTAYRNIHDKHILHLALLLHDLGKGFERDHSEVGREIAERTAGRFRMRRHQRDQLVFLVHKHLRMTHLAFRRDTADMDVLIPFAHETGAPETLRMLYVLSAADLMAVGPGVWTEWKGELLTELFDRTMLMLSGNYRRHDEERRQERFKNEVRGAIAPRTTGADPDWDEWLQRELDALPPHYLSGTPPAQIAADLETIRHLPPHAVHVEGKYDAEKGTVDYRLIAREGDADGCFHKTCGVLTAKRMEILGAQISTSADGYIVDGYRVIDNDFAGEVPPERIAEVAAALRDVLSGRTAVPPLFQRHMTFGARRQTAPISDQETRVVIDNHSSDRCTVVDVFAHDRPGLLYTITRALWEMGLSVYQAKISTHLDQIVDVFYVTDQHGRKIDEGHRLRQIQAELFARLAAFEEEGHRQFVP